MSTIEFHGPVEIDPALAMALWESMPKVAQGGVAQLFFSRFVTAPISEAALVAGARVFFEREKIGSDTANRIREAVFKKCDSVATGSVNEEKFSALAAQNMGEWIKQFGAERAKALVDSFFGNQAELLGAVRDGVTAAVRDCARFYFTRTPQGEARLAQLLTEALESQKPAMADIAIGAVSEAVAGQSESDGPPVGRVFGGMGDDPGRRVDEQLRKTA